MLHGMRDPPRMKVGGEDAMTLNLTRRMWLGALPGLAFAGAAAAQTPAMVPQDDLTASLDTWLDLYGRPTAKVMLNGRGPFSFMVDTGSTVTVLAQRHLETIGAPLVGTATVAGTTGMAETPFARINSVEAGDLKKRDVRVAVLPDDGVSHIDGILGADAFVGKRLEFSIPAKSVKILNSRHPIRVPPRSQMRIRNGLLAEIDGEILQARLHFENDDLTLRIDGHNIGAAAVGERDFGEARQTELGQHALGAAHDFGGAAGGNRIAERLRDWRHVKHRARGSSC